MNRTCASHQPQAPTKPTIYLCNFCFTGNCFICLRIIFLPSALCSFLWLYCCTLCKHSNNSRRIREEEKNEHKDNGEQQVGITSSRRKTYEGIIDYIIAEYLSKSIYMILFAKMAEFQGSKRPLFYRVFTKTHNYIVYSNAFGQHIR